MLESLAHDLDCQLCVISFTLPLGNDKGIRIICWVEAACGLFVEHAVAACFPLARVFGMTPKSQKFFLLVVVVIFLFRIPRTFAQCATARCVDLTW